MDNKYVRLAHEAADVALAARVPGEYWVEFLPFLKYIPDWVPGIRFKEHAKSGGRIWRRLWNEMFDEVKQDLVSGGTILTSSD